MVVITAALPYANGDLHLGHARSTYVQADVYARFLRMKGEKVYFVCGSDEHGTPIMFNAEKKGISPEEFVKQYRERQKRTFERLGISVDIFYHTHSPEHERLTLWFFERLKENGYIYKRPVKEYYCPKCQRFLPDRYVKGKCPYCGAEDQYGDQCEVCGRALNAEDLIDPKCALCGTPPEIREREHWFFKLSAFEDKLRAWYENAALQKDARNYALAWVKEGLHDWDIVRDIDWGIPAPGGGVFYVWFDAPIGYISFLSKLGDWKKLWQDVYHFIGKDNTFHHYIFWPAMLMGVGLELPKDIPVRGFLTLEGKKFSKSRNWYITIDDFLDVFPADYLRFYLVLTTPASITDTDFSLAEFQKRINGDLVDNVGNLLRRITVLAQKFGYDPPNIPSYPEVERLYRQRDFKKALETILEEFHNLNALLNQTEPWKTGNKAIIGEILGRAVSLLRYLYPVIPFSAAALLEKFGGSPEAPRVERIPDLVPFQPVEDSQLEALRTKVGLKA